MMNKKKAILLALLALVALFVVACQPTTVEVTKVVEVETEVTRVVTEVIEGEGGEVEVTRHCYRSGKLRNPRTGRT
ncbi:MAG: hypothetical protein IPL78_15240 [Chloroflexi bacterium]|nr:hypothetical protein [Chloroflexota bacterium]